jgi:hypothetical protein
MRQKGLVPHDVLPGHGMRQFGQTKDGRTVLLDALSMRPTQVSPKKFEQLTGILGRPGPEALGKKLIENPTIANRAGGGTIDDNVFMRLVMEGEPNAATTAPAYNTLRAEVAQKPKGVLGSIGQHLRNAFVTPGKLDFPWKVEPGASG